MGILDLNNVVITTAFCLSFFETDVTTDYERMPREKIVFTAWPKNYSLIDVKQTKFNPIPTSKKSYIKDLPWAESAHA